MQVLTFHHAAETGSDRIEVDDVGHVENRLRIVLDARGRLLLEAVIVVGDAARAREAHVHPDRGGAGASVEGNDERALTHIGDPVLRVAHIEHLRDDLALVTDGDPPRLRRIGDRLAVEGSRVLRDGGLGGQEVRFLAGLRPTGGSCGWGAGASALGEYVG